MACVYCAQKKQQQKITPDLTQQTVLFRQSKLLNEMRLMVPL